MADAHGAPVLAVLGTTSPASGTTVRVDLPALRDRYWGVFWRWWYTIPAKERQARSMKLGHGTNCHN